MEPRLTKYLREIDWDLRTVNELNQLDLNYAQQLQLGDHVPYATPGYSDVLEKLTVTITVPTKSEFLDRQNARLVLYLTSSGSESIITDLTAKKNLNNPKLRWLFETCYTVSINWNKDKYYGWGTRPPARMFFDVLVELEDQFPNDDKRFLIGHSQGGMACFGAIIHRPYFLNNIIISAGYMMIKPGQKIGSMNNTIVIE